LLERNMRALDKASYRRQRAVLLTARAQALEGSDRDSAKTFALEAQKLAPTLVPAAALAGRLLAEGGQVRKASRVIDSAWRANPHPELAQAYIELRPGESARDRLKRIEALAKRIPEHIEGALAVARAALDAQEFAKARAALGPYLAAASRRVALLMAELERAERNDEGRAREWLARAVHAAPDPAWTADGHVSDHWHPVSPVSGRLDAFEWRVPLTGTLRAPTLEPEPPHAAPIEIAPAAKPDTEPVVPGPVEVLGSGQSAPPQSKPEPKPESKPQPVIPLVHAPDDPGPDDPGPDGVEVSEPPAEPQTGWRKIFG